MNTAMGYIDGTIGYCPYCGGELDEASFIGETTCEHCGKCFIVIEGEE